LVDPQRAEAVEARARFGDDLLRFGGGDDVFQRFFAGGRELGQLEQRRRT